MEEDTAMPVESLILLLAAAALFILMISRTRRQQRSMQTLQAGVTVGSRIMTTAGLHATVVDLGDGTVTLETAPGHRSTWDRRAIARILSEEPDVEAPGDQEDGVGEPAGQDNTQDGSPGAGVPSQDAAPPDRA